MAKKIILGLVLALVAAGGVFAQEKQTSDVKNWFSGEVSILGAGVRYERMLSEKFSIGANVYYNTLIIWNDFDVGFSFRGYVWRQLLFVGGQVGFHTHRVGLALGRIIGAAITPEIGFRIDVGDAGKFFLQPGIKIPITLGGYKSYYYWNDSSYKAQFRAGVGVIPYLGLGYAF